MATIKIVRKNPETGNHEYVEFDEIEYLKIKHNLPDADEETVRLAEDALIAVNATENDKRGQARQRAKEALKRLRAYTPPEGVTNAQALAEVLTHGSLIKDITTIFGYLALVDVDSSR